MVIVNVCKLEYTRNYDIEENLYLKKSVSKVTVRKKNWEVLLFKLTGVYFIVSAMFGGFFCFFLFYFGFLFCFVFFANSQ